MLLVKETSRHHFAIYFLYSPQTKDLYEMQKLFVGITTSKQIRFDISHKSKETIYMYMNHQTMFSGEKYHIPNSFLLLLLFREKR